MAKEHKEDYGSYILNNKENILRRKRKIIILKRIIFLFMVLLTILITLGLTLPDFNIDKIQVSGAETITEEEILEMAAIEPEKNIFKVNTRKSEKAILENPYIQEVKIKRKLPNKILIQVKEENVAFYVEQEGIYTVDIEGNILGQKESLESINALKLEGIPKENIVIGENVQGQDKSGFQGAKIVYNFLSKKDYFQHYQELRLEITNLVDYKLHVNKAYIKLGTSENMDEKLAKAFSILSAPEYLNLQGYIDVSFDGNPVVYKEN